MSFCALTDQWSSIGVPIGTWWQEAGSREKRGGEEETHQKLASSKERTSENDLPWRGCRTWSNYLWQGKLPQVVPERLTVSQRVIVENYWILKVFQKSQQFFWLLAPGTLGSALVCGLCGLKQQSWILGQST